MELDSNLYLHDSDKAALATLKAIPGFTQVMRAFMKVWNEQQFKIINMSTNLKLSERQMKKYYEYLPPICEKLNIKIPEMYVELDVRPNAYTAGDTNPFIVLTSGLFETLPDELIPTVIAHECGHIACHHSLYMTMGRAIINGTFSFVGGLDNLALYPIQIAFAYWMRCSEFSADRAAIICDGGSDKVVEMCMRFAGCDKDIMAEYDVEEFMSQAKEYKDMVAESAWNKILEFLLFQQIDHPLNAVRAYEGREWSNSERFNNIMDYLNSSSDVASLKLPVQLNPKKLIGKGAEDVQTKLMGLGFSNISMVRTTEETGKKKSGEVIKLSINGSDELKEDFYKRDSEIIVTYYENKTVEEISNEHLGQILIKENSKYFVGKDYSEIHSELENLGFVDISDKEMALPKFGKWGKEGTVAKILIGEKSQFDKNSWFDPTSKVVLYYYVVVE
ncbi:MAG: M48 family metallopeptidase [Lachnospiraceae bacterium]|nr:M48 family metallopeptidase [Lachnospiraceae bacterium]